MSFKKAKEFQKKLLAAIEALIDKDPEFEKECLQIAIIFESISNTGKGNIDLAKNTLQDESFCPVGAQSLSEELFKVRSDIHTILNTMNELANAISQSNLAVAENIIQKFENETPLLALQDQFESLNEEAEVQFGGTITFSQFLEIIFLAKVNPGNALVTNSMSIN